MVARVLDFRHIHTLYERDFTHDLPPQTERVKRLGLAVIPFLTLHPALRMPVATFMGSLRAWNSAGRQEWGNTAISVAAVVVTFFNYPVGMAVTTVQDIIIQINKVRAAKNWEEAAKSLFKILNNLFFLALILRGGFELTIIAFLMQGVVNLIQSQDEFNKDRWIEGVSNLLLGSIRLYQGIDAGLHPRMP